MNSDWSGFRCMNCDKRFATQEKLQKHLTTRAHDETALRKIEQSIAARQTEIDALCGTRDRLIEKLRKPEAPDGE